MDKLPILGQILLISDSFWEVFDSNNEYIRCMRINCEYSYNATFSLSFLNWHKL
jgi:hypothetical protein